MINHFQTWQRWCLTQPSPVVEVPQTQVIETLRQVPSLEYEEVVKQAGNLGRCSLFIIIWPFTHLLACLLGMYIVIYVYTYRYMGIPVILDFIYIHIDLYIYIYVYIYLCTHIVTY